MLPAEEEISSESASESAFQKALSKWRDVDLTTLQTQLDKQGMEIIASQKDFLVERKELSTKTKFFRKLPDDEKLSQVMSLLKAYQGMIDALTNRSKTAESAFLSIYKLLAEAPDPYPILEATVAELLNSEEATRLAEENARLRDQLEKQGDVNQLRMQLRQMEVQSEESTKQKVAQKETEMLALIDEKERNWAEREQEYQRQITDSRDMVKELKVSQEVVSARLSAQDQKFDEGVVGRLAELDIVVADLERSNLRIAEVERRNGELRTEIAALQSGKGTAAEQRANKLETSVRSLELEYDTVVQRLEHMQEEIKSEREGVQKRTKNLELEVSRQQEEASALKSKLRSLDDYDEIKRELEILKHIEFSIVDDDDDDKDDLDSNNLENDSRGSSLETLLVSRNKKLSNDLTILKVAHSDLESRLSELQSSYNTALQDLERHKSLNEKLEEDLSRMNDHATAYAGSVVGSTRYTMRAPTNRPSSPTSSIIGSRDDAFNKTATPEASILPIVTQQRDRFRGRNAELEEDLRKQLTIISSLRSEIQTLQKDNLGLYEKARYLQQYAKGAAADGNANSLEEGHGASGSLRPGSGIGLERYRNAYEESITPFEAFRGKESARVYRNLNPLEKIVYSLTRAVLANRYSRNAFFLYCIGLHLLVVIVLYWLATAEHEQHVGWIKEGSEEVIENINSS